MMQLVVDRNLPLVDALIDVVGCLRARQYEGVRDSLWTRLLSDADRFASHLVLHVLAKEEHLFRALKEAIPGVDGVLGPLEHEHADLRAQANDVVTYVREGDAVKALTLSRDLLRRLLDHIREEERVLDRLAAGLDGRSRRRLREILGTAYAQRDRTSSPGRRTRARRTSGFRMSAPSGRLRRTKGRGRLT